MLFHTREELDSLAGLLSESDFDRGDCRWEGEGAEFVLETSRPGGSGKAAGLLRKPASDWIKCRLTVRQVRRVSMWEEYDTQPSGGGLIEVRPEGGRFTIRFRSAHGLRVDVTVERLDGSLEDMENRKHS